MTDSAPPEEAPIEDVVDTALPEEKPQSSVVQGVGFADGVVSDPAPEIEIAKAEVAETTADEELVQEVLQVMKEEEVRDGLPSISELLTNPSQYQAVIAHLDKGGLAVLLTNGKVELFASCDLITRNRARGRLGLTLARVLNDLRR